MTLKLIDYKFYLKLVFYIKKLIYELNLFKKLLVYYRVIKIIRFQWIIIIFEQY